MDGWLVCHAAFVVPIAFALYRAETDAARLALITRDPYQRDLQRRGAVSIEASGGDRYLRFARVAFPLALSHRSTSGASTSLRIVTSRKRRIAVLVGHGDAGLILTGADRTNPRPSHLISVDNEQHWRPRMQRLVGRVDELVLLSCSSGAELAGARLVQRLACAVDAPVRAPTGFVAVNLFGKIMLMQGAQWQTGKCSAMPTPLKIAKSLLPKSAFTPFGGERVRERIAIPYVTSARFTPAMHLPLPGYRFEPLLLEGTDAIDLVDGLNPHPVELPPLAGVLAVRYGWLDLTFGEGGTSRSARYGVLAGGVLQPVRDRRLMYEPFSSAFLRRLVGGPLE